MLNASASVLRSMFPLAASVLTPVPPIIRALDSCRTMFPEVEFVATSVAMVVSMSSAPPADPIPVAAFRVAVPVVVILAVSAVVTSVMAPAVAVMLMVLLVVVISPRMTLVAARSVTAPLPVP